MALLGCFDMDKMIVAVEETDLRGNKSLALESKCVGSPVQIKSIAIDLDLGEIESPKHQHFSILGFAAEMRKKGRKLCLPFATEGDDDDVNLPPLPVPKFRWWQCSDCVLDTLDQKRSLGKLIHAVKEKDGDEHVSRNSRYDNNNYTRDKLVYFDSERHKFPTDARKNEDGNLFRCITTEDNHVQMKEITHNNCADKNVSNGPYNPENDISESDSDIPFSSLPPKRKPKLRSLADIIKEDTNLIPIQQTETELNPQAHTDAANKTLYRKRKIVLEEDEEEEEDETDHPVPTAKRLKGPVTESGNNTFRCFEISKAESRRDKSGPVLFDSRLSAKTHQNKVRKPRSLDINTKTRRADTENRTFRATLNLHKYPPVSAGTSFGDMGPFFNNALTGQQMDSVSNMSKDKRVEEGHYSPYTPPSNKDGLRNCNNKNQEKIALDLSLGSYTGSSRKKESPGMHTEIPDLNESFVEKTSMTEGLQLLSLHQKDMFASSGKETDNNSTVEVEAGNVPDDIPMEIVELLAKNQRERSLSNSRKHLVPNCTHSNNPLNVPSPFIEGNPCTFIPISISSGTLCVYSNLSKNCDLDRGQFRQFVSGSRASNGADLLWSPRRKNITFDVISQPVGSENQSYKGINVRRTVTNRSLVRERSIGLSCESASSIDAYSNDTIPAMQLLSLMDQRIVSGSSCKVGGSNDLLDRQSSSCFHHPRPVLKNGNPNDSFVSSSSFFGQSNRTNDFPTLLNGVRYSGDFSAMSYLSRGNMTPPKGNSEPIDLAGPTNISVQPLRTSNPMLEVCTLNRNPADFSIPDARNEFMISAKDLKLKKRNLSNENSRPGNVGDPRKRRLRNDS